MSCLHKRRGCLRCTEADHVADGKQEGHSDNANIRAILCGLDRAETTHNPQRGRANSTCDQRNVSSTKPLEASDDENTATKHERSLDHSTSERVDNAKLFQEDSAIGRCERLTGELIGARSEKTDQCSSLSGRR